MYKRFADAIIIGGGVTGTAITYYLSKTGIQPILIEESNLNAGASGACDEGIVLQSKHTGIMLDMVLKSAKLYKTLEDELNYPIGYRNVGGMIIINEEKYIPVIETFIKKQQQQGLNIHMLHPSDIHKQQPGLSKKVVASAFSKDDCNVYPFKLTLGYVEAAKRLGAKVLLHNRVNNITINKNTLGDKRRELRITTNEHEILTPIVVDATGCGSRQIGKMLGLEIPVFPSRGQIVITEQIPPLIKHQIMDAKFIVAKHKPQLVEKNNALSNLNVGLTIGQAETGNTLIGGCREQVGYNTSTSFSTIREIVKNAADFFPFMKDVSIIRSFAGLRPTTPDNLPILSQTPIPRFYIASGLGGDGLSLSPIVGKIMADLITKGNCNIVDISQLSLDRFFNIG